MAPLFGRSRTGERDVDKLVVGLGNPGPEYAATRHNLGFRIVERFADEHRFGAFARGRTGLEARGRVDGQRVAVLKPLSYMNRSGASVSRRLAELGLDLGNVLVCYDELALPLGRLRLRRGGSAAGHNGVQSLIDALGSSEFPRLRLGIRPDEPFEDQVDFVLAPFRRSELAVVEEVLPRAAQAVASFCRDGIERAMNRYNREEP